MKLIVSAGESFTTIRPIKCNQKNSEFDQVGNVKFAVRIQDLQNPDYASTCEYFNLAEHQYDQISIQLQITFDEDVSGDELTWGNDFDEPIRDILPYGFSLALGLFRYLDKGLVAEPYIDKPYLYGKAITSMNKCARTNEWKILATDEMQQQPEFASNTDRINYYLDESNRAQFVFKKGETWMFDFYTPYITMGKEFAIKLPGYNLNVEKYCGTQPLRYTLKAGSRVLAVVVFDVKN